MMKITPPIAIAHMPALSRDSPGVRCASLTRTGGYSYVPILLKPKCDER
jgi:hypothetical protein